MLSPVADPAQEAFRHLRAVVADIPEERCKVIDEKGGQEGELVLPVIHRR
jgi:hypothetical protein